MTQSIYNYHQQTGEFINEIEADESPLEPGVILVPAFATIIKPPTTAVREVAVFADEHWQVKADWRGVTLFSTVDGSSVVIDEIGKTPADTGSTEKAMPSTAHSWKDGAWSPDPVKVAAQQTEAKSAKWNAIKTKRDAIKAGGVKVGTKWYHSDETSRTQYIGLLRMADAAVAAGGTGSTTLQYGGQDIQWKTMDGTFIKMTVQRANDVFNAVSGLDFAAFGTAETHKAAMEASADPASYDFAAGWPATFGG